MSSCTERTKERAIIAACNRTLQFPIRVLINSGTKSLQTSSVSWPKQQAGSPCQLKPTACKLNPVARCQLNSFPCSSATISQPTEPPQTDPAAQNHLACPFVIKGTKPDSTPLPACFCAQTQTVIMFLKIQAFVLQHICVISMPGALIPSQVWADFLRIYCWNFLAHRANKLRCHTRSEPLASQGGGRSKKRSFFSLGTRC